MLDCKPRDTNSRIRCNNARPLECDLHRLNSFEEPLSNTRFALLDRFGCDILKSPRYSAAVISLLAPPLEHTKSGHRYSHRIMNKIYAISVRYKPQVFLCQPAKRIYKFKLVLCILSYLSLIDKIYYIERLIPARRACFRVYSAAGIEKAV